MAGTQRQEHAHVSAVQLRVAVAAQGPTGEFDRCSRRQSARADCDQRTRRNGTTTPASTLRSRSATGLRAEAVPSPMRSGVVSSAYCVKNVGRHRSYAYASSRSGREPDETGSTAASRATDHVAVAAHAW